MAHLIGRAYQLPQHLDNIDHRAELRFSFEHPLKGRCCFGTEFGLVGWRSITMNTE